MRFGSDWASLEGWGRRSATARWPPDHTWRARDKGPSVSNGRDEFPERVKRELELAAGTRCSLPVCRADTTAVGAEGIIRIGVACHITAASEGGPRFDPDLSPEERRSASNGIWMCADHARLIDVDDPNYPTERLREWKDLAERRPLGVRSSAPGPRSIDERLLARFPGPCRRRLLAAAPVDPELVQQVVRWLGNPDERQRNLRHLADRPPDWLASRADAWLLLAMVADAHREPIAADLYQRAAQDEADPDERLFRTARAVQCTAQSDPEQAIDDLRDLTQRADLSESQLSLVTLLLAAQEQDPEAILDLWSDAIGVTSEGDVTARQFMAQALRVLGRLDESIQAFESISTSDHSGVQLLLAETLLVRGTSERSPSRVADCRRSREIALLVRDDRRTWGGESGGAALVAAQASAALDDWSAVIRIGSDVAGEATPAEARTAELAELVGVAHLFEGSTANDAGAGQPSPSGAAWLRGMQLGSDPSNRESAREAFEEATTLADGALELERSLRGLAALGVHPLPRLAELEELEPAHARSLDALARYRSAPSDAALGDLRRVSSEARMAASFLCMIEAERGNAEVAAQIALDAADRFHDPSLRVLAVSSLIEEDPARAETIASESVQLIEPGLPARLDLRRALVDLAVRSGNPVKVEAAARGALNDGLTDERLNWLVVNAQLSQGRGVGAWETISNRALQPETEHQAQLFLAAHSEGAPEGSEGALDVLDEFNTSHDVMATGLLLYLTTSPDVRPERDDPDLGRRYGAHLEHFATTFPDSDAIWRIQVDTSDPAQAVADLEQQLPTSNAGLEEAFAAVERELDEGRVPAGAAQPSSTSPRSHFCVPASQQLHPRFPPDQRSRSSEQWHWS